MAVPSDTDLEKLIKGSKEVIDRLQKSGQTGPGSQELDQLIKCSDESVARMQRWQEGQHPLSRAQRLRHFFHRNRKHAGEAAFAGIILLLAAGRLEEKYSTQVCGLYWRGCCVCECTVLGGLYGSSGAALWPGPGEGAVVCGVGFCANSVRSVACEVPSKYGIHMRHVRCMGACNEQHPDRRRSGRSCLTVCSFDDFRRSGAARQTGERARDVAVGARQVRCT